MHSLKDGEQKMALLRPAIFKFHYESLPPEHRALHEWGWVNIRSLSPAVEKALERKNVPLAFDYTPAGLIERFGLLCGNHEGKARLSWIWA